MKMFVMLAGKDPDIDSLAQYISHKEDRVEIVADAGQAQRYAEFRREQGHPYDLAILDWDSLPGQPLELVANLRRADPQLAVALLVPFMESGEIKPQADHLGCSAVFPKPVDLSTVQQFLQRQSFLNTTSFGLRKIQSTSYTKRSLRAQGGQNTPTQVTRIRTPATGTEAPFFGTGGRHSEGSDTQARLPENSSGTQYRRHRSGTINIPGDGTNRIRRSVTGSLRKGDGEQGPAGGGQEQGGGRIKKVRCAHCSEVFQVTTKAQPFTMPCIHCGQLNKIMP